MSKEDILREFETDLSDPESVKSGEYLETHILTRAREALLKDRVGLLEALRDWPAMKNEPRTMLAVKVTKEMKLKELMSDLMELRKEIENGKAFLPFYIRWIDETLDAIKDSV